MSSIQNETCSSDDDRILEKQVLFSIESFIQLYSVGVFQQLLFLWVLLQIKFSGEFLNLKINSLQIFATQPSLLNTTDSVNDWRLLIESPKWSHC